MTESGHSDIVDMWHALVHYNILLKKKTHIKHIQDISKLFLLLASSAKNQYAAANSIYTKLIKIRQIQHVQALSENSPKNVANQTW